MLRRRATQKVGKAATRCARCAAPAALLAFLAPSPVVLLCCLFYFHPPLYISAGYLCSRLLSVLLLRRPPRPARSLFGAPPSFGAPPRLTSRYRPVHRPRFIGRPCISALSARPSIWTGRSSCKRKQTFRAIDVFFSVSLVLHAPEAAHETCGLRSAAAVADVQCCSVWGGCGRGCTMNPATTCSPRTAGWTCCTAAATVPSSSSPTRRPRR